MSAIDLSGMAPLFLIEIYHRNPGATPVWFRTLNAFTKTEATRAAILLFIGEGLDEILIDEINTVELKGGPDA